MLSRVYTSGIMGIDGFLVTVECSAWKRIPKFDLVGLPDAAGILLFYALGAGVVFVGMKLVGICEKYAVAAMAAVVLYVLPVALFLLGYLVTMSGWGGGAGFLLGIGAVIAYDRLVAKKEQIQYTITGYAQKKGDNDLG